MFQKICNFLLGVIIVMLMGLAIVLILPRAMGYQSMAVLSGSMEPELPVGAIVYAKAIDFQDICVGDVITYRLSGNTVVTHRVKEVNHKTQEMITQGDANDATDANPVHYSDVVGKVAFSLPYIGFLSIYIKTPLGIAAVCGMLIILILLLFLPDILNDGKEEGKHKPTKEVTQ